LGNNLNQRDTIAVRRTTSGLLKLVCPNGEYTKDSVRKCLEYALEARRRVKEQLKKIGGMEFYDVHFSYIDLEDGVERFVTVPEQSSGALVPEGRLQPGTLHTISMGSSEMPGIYRLEIQSIPGTGKANVSGVAPREAVRVAFDYFKANSSRVSASIKPGERDFHTHLVELQVPGHHRRLPWPALSHFAQQPWASRCSLSWL
jgi:ATP-dependent Lon protease